MTKKNLVTVGHYRIIGKRLIDRGQNAIVKSSSSAMPTIVDDRKTGGQEDLHSDQLRERVLEIVTETLWRRVLEKASAAYGARRQRRPQRRRETTARSSDPIESALTVSSILPVNRPAAFKCRSRAETVSHNDKRYDSIFVVVY